MSAKSGARDDSAVPGQCRSRRARLICGLWVGRWGGVCINLVCWVDPHTYTSIDSQSVRSTGRPIQRPCIPQPQPPVSLSL